MIDTQNKNKNDYGNINSRIKQIRYSLLINYICSDTNEIKSSRSSKKHNDELTNY